jgi:Leucine-rich repeat (LRR) protein
MEYEQYEDAEKEIEDAREMESRGLDLSGMRLNKLPASIKELKQLESLNLSSNQLEVLPRSIGELTRLKKLDLKDNLLTRLPESIGNLTHLVFLDASENSLSSLPKSIGNLQGLQKLFLNDNQLTKLPITFNNLTNLLELSLSGNKLITLHNLLETFTKLQVLGLADNQLTSLPDVFDNLQDLKELYLSNNCLAVLPGSLGYVPQLQKLYLDNNRITSLPESIGLLKRLRELDLSKNSLIALPGSFGELEELRDLNLSENQLISIPEAMNNLIALEQLNLFYNELEFLPENFGALKALERLVVSNNLLKDLPKSICQLDQLTTLDIANNQLSTLPDRIDQLTLLRSLIAWGNLLQQLPTSLHKLTNLENVDLNENPLNPELSEAYKQGLSALKTYLRARAIGQITLNEVKLILVGEGEVGKTCLIDALLGNPWQKHDTTHGIQIKPIKAVDSHTQKEVTLNGWDFGGQRVYRPTHQLFFSAPAVYLVVWKPREGPQQGFVKEWIHLIKRREPSAKVIVVATHGGPRQRQPDIDRQELWDMFGRETIVDFFFVDSKPERNGKRRGIEELKRTIASVAAMLPEVGRTVPKSFIEAQTALQSRGVPYMSLNEVLAICGNLNMDSDVARLFITISHRLGHLTHYENDPTLRDIVILRPDWLATAISYVLDDEQTRAAHGLVKFSRLSQLWDDKLRPDGYRYPRELHPIFLRLMERFDLSYRVADPSSRNDTDPQSLIAQLVPDIRPANLELAWTVSPNPGDIQQTQICRIVDTSNGQSANAEGLFYQLIVRLHRYSLGRSNYLDSVHWQRGLVLDNSYNGRAFLEHKGNDIHITVRAPYPDRFLAMLTEEVKYLVESFWEGLRCDITVPCLNPKLCLGLFDVSKLIENKRRGYPEQPCPICNEWQNIDKLLLNAPEAAQPISIDLLMKEFAEVKNTLSEVNDNTRRILSQVEQQYADFIQIFTDEAKEGPRLFSFFPLDRSNFNPRKWIRAQFRLVLWCEHSRLPLPVLNDGNMKKGVYDLEIEREWFIKSAPYLKLVTNTVSLVLPVASSVFKLIDENAFKIIENQLDLSKKVIDGITGEGKAVGEFMGKIDTSTFEHGSFVRAENATLRALHTLLKSKDPSFGGLIRVMNKHQKFLWVHEKFASEY